jgi:DNA-directed RNA polymerase subunit H (RpoH/RPB5)
MLAFLLFAVLSQGFSYDADQNLVVSFCKDTENGKWRDNLQYIFAITRVGITEIYCSGVRSNDIVVGVTIGDQYEQMIMPPDLHNVDAFLASILRKVSSTRIRQINTKEDLTQLMQEDKEIIISFIRERDSIEHRVYQQIALSHDSNIPGGLIMAATHNAEIFPDSVVLNDSVAMETWFIQNGKWIALEIPDNMGGEMTPEEVYFKLMSYIKHIKYPSILFYVGADDYMDTYNGTQLNFVLVFQSANQLSKMIENLVEPLSEELKLYFAFIVIDADEYPDMLDRYDVKKSSLPMIVSIKPRQKRGVHIESSEVPYTVESLMEVCWLVIKVFNNSSTHELYRSRIC